MIFLKRQLSLGLITTRSGRTAVALFVLILPMLSLSSPVQKEDRHPLAPANTSSPRATLRTFIDNTNVLYHTYLKEGYTLENKDLFDGLADRAVDTLDLSKVPTALARLRGVEIAALLKEVLDRLELPPYETIPDATAMRSLEEAGNPPRWRIPNTDITIARASEGPHKGDYVFTADTVAKAQEYYDRIQHLPYQPGSSVGIYSISVHAPGWMIPHTWIFALPTWTRTTYLELPLWKWISLLVVLGLGGIALWAIFRWSTYLRQHSFKKWHWSNLMLPLSFMIVTGAQGIFLEEQINLQGIALEVVSSLLWLAFFVAAIFAVLAIGNGVAEAVIDRPHIKPKGIDANMIRITTRTLSFLMTFYIIIAGGQFLGIPLTPLLAGLGVGGFAVALAARPTLENFIGGMTLFADKPVRVGDYCRFGETLGTVEEIGFRSTRIRTKGRTIISIPNSKFSELQLENFDRRDHIWLHAVLALRCETTPEQLRYVLTRVREMLVAHPKTEKHLPLRVRFVGFNDYSLDVEVSTYVNTRAWDEFLGVREDVFLRIMDIVEQAGAGFAFPSQITYLTRDQKLDAELVGAAEAEVQQWRNEGRLPFPDMSSQRRQQLKDTLDFPPTGSPQGSLLHPRAVPNPPADKDSIEKNRR